ncbi:hypothetical protein HUW51_01020 (plasmid) [Adhaeribacter swui]|uniref:Uncharacterized protein n=1 Tax=Adhaeribacter swui TaxID=2086471 RepID=A0A7G7G2I6_9BACT|nr:hypothetical protein [Adhaeribacter swui]QNF31370.1 hypothetical protein HUW51_01020 [Adhaeribacter swui]
MLPSKPILPAEQMANVQQQLSDLDFTRRQLFHFVPTEHNLVMTFTLPDGQPVNVPIENPYKTRMLLAEVRTYLGEQELLQERQLNRLKAQL